MLSCNVHKLKFLSGLQPKVVTATDEAELARQMEKAEAENAEVAGDDDEADEEGITYNSGGEDRDGGGDDDEDDDDDEPAEKKGGKKGAANGLDD